MTLVERKGREWAMTFDAIQQPIFLTTDQGVIVRCNRAARDLARASEYGEVLDRPIGKIAPAEPWITLGDVATAVAQGGEPCMAHVENEDAIFDIEATPDADGDRIIISLRDTTEVVRLQESVRRGEQLAALGELVAGVAHQVKNPLFGIGMTIDLLEQKMLADPENEELFGALRRWLRRLDRLMESLLAYGKTWSVDLVPHPLREVVEQAIDICRPTAGSRAVQIVLEGSGDAILLMDPQRLVHAFENLVTNAAQYAPNGSIVTVGLEASEGSALVTVQDQGAGFREEDLPRIFEPFFTRRRGGTGLGLSIVQRIVDEHGGTVTAANAPSGGAVVRVSLPQYGHRTAASDRHAPHSHR
jgi:signal transduction histidine kinase